MVIRHGLVSGTALPAAKTSSAANAVDLGGCAWPLETTLQIIVLGMHRSGTSAWTRLINMMGAYMGPEAMLSGPGFDNPKGFWERLDVRDINDRLLSLVGASWDCVVDLDFERAPAKELSALEDEARSTLIGLDSRRPWVLKDPRFCVVFSFWRPLLEVPVCVHLHRSPLEIAKSLEKRNGFSLAVGVALWERYNRSALMASRGLPRTLVSYRDLMRDGKTCVQGLLHQLESFGVRGLSEPSGAEIAAFLNEQLWHHRQLDDCDLPSLLNPTQLDLLQAFEDGNVLERESMDRMSVGGTEVLQEHSRVRNSFQVGTSTWQGESTTRAASVKRNDGEGQHPDGEMKRLRGLIEDSILRLSLVVAEVERERASLCEGISQWQRASAQLEADREEIERQTAENREAKKRLEQLRSELELERRGLQAESARAESRRIHLRRETEKIERARSLVETYRQRIADAEAKERENGRLWSRIAELEERSSDLETQLLRLETELHSVHSSRLWRFGHLYWSLRRVVAFRGRGKEAAPQSTLPEKSAVPLAGGAAASDSLGSVCVTSPLDPAGRAEGQRSVACQALAPGLASQIRSHSSADLDGVESGSSGGPARGGGRRSLGQPSAIAVAPRPRTATSHRRAFVLQLGDVPTFDVFCFPIIDWEFRFQRPQQLARQFSAKGHRCYFLRGRFHSGGTGPEIEVLEDGVAGVVLPGPTYLSIYERRMSETHLGDCLDAIEQLVLEEGVVQAVCLVQLPFWTSLAFALRSRFGWKVIYDCMDELRGFENTAEEMLEEEADLVARSDMTVATAKALYEKLLPTARRVVTIPNAGDYEHFHSSRPRQLDGVARPIIGYYGAIAEWFDVDLIIEAAKDEPSWYFVLIGGIHGAEVSGLEALDNVHLLGEIPYRELPGYLHAFDVALIPFKISSLTLATNPVKFYEYLSAGKPVVAVDLPELRPYSDYYYPVRSSTEFVPQIRKALSEDSVGKKRQRSLFACENTWQGRQEVLSSGIRSLYGKAVVVIVSFENLDYLKLCLDSVVRETIYPRYEVVVVDNASSEAVRQYLRDRSRSDPRLRVVLNDENIGFAAANNLGIRRAGNFEYLALLNNDVIVTRGWLSRLIQHLERPGVELVGPVTNWAGNEARIPVDYEDVEDMPEFAERYVRQNEGEFFDISVLAMFCVAMRRSLIDRIGLLDERFGIGMFEDDDFAKRVREDGGRVVCAEDVYVHHWGRSSFATMGEERYSVLFEANRRLFEEKWGEPWVPHQHRAGS